MAKNMLSAQKGLHRSWKTCTPQHSCRVKVERQDTGHQERLDKKKYIFLGLASSKKNVDHKRTLKAGRPALCIFQICAAPVATKNSSGSEKHCHKATPGKVSEEGEVESEDNRRRRRRKGED